MNRLEDTPVEWAHNVMRAPDHRELADKINELVDAVNEMQKEKKVVDLSLSAIIALRQANGRITEEMIAKAKQIDKLLKQEPEMKLYWIDCSCAHPSLVPAKSEKDALKQCGSYYDGLQTHVEELKEVDGYRIKLEKIEV